MAVKSKTALGRVEFKSRASFVEVRVSEPIDRR
jgi:hypothetical protein